MSTSHLCPSLCISLAFAVAASAHAETSAQAMPETMDMLRHAIATQSVEGKGQVQVFAQYLAGKLESAGLPSPISRSSRSGTPPPWSRTIAAATGI